MAKYADADILAAFLGETLPTHAEKAFADELVDGGRFVFGTRATTFPAAHHGISIVDFEPGRGVDFVRPAISPDAGGLLSSDVGWGAGSSRGQRLAAAICAWRAAFTTGSEMGRDLESANDRLFAELCAVRDVAEAAFPRAAATWAVEIGKMRAMFEAARDGASVPRSEIPKTIDGRSARRIEA